MWAQCAVQSQRQRKSSGNGRAYCLPWTWICVHAQSFCWVQLSVTPGIVAHQAPLSMGFSRQENWSGLPCPPPGDFSDPGVEPKSPVSPALQVDSLPPEPLGKTESRQFLLNDVWGLLNMEIMGKIAVLEYQVCVCVCVFKEGLLNWTRGQWGPGDRARSSYLCIKSSEILKIGYREGSAEGSTWNEASRIKIAITSNWNTGSFPVILIVPRASLICIFLKSLSRVYNHANFQANFALKPRRRGGEGMLRKADLGWAGKPQHAHQA